MNEKLCVLSRIEDTQSREGSGIKEDEPQQKLELCYIQLIQTVPQKASKH